MTSDSSTTTIKAVPANLEHHLLDPYFAWANRQRLAEIAVQARDIQMPPLSSCEGIHEATQRYVTELTRRLGLGDVPVVLNEISPATRHLVASMGFIDSDGIWVSTGMPTNPMSYNREDRFMVLNKFDTHLQTCVVGRDPAEFVRGTGAHEVVHHDQFHGDRDLNVVERLRRRGISIPSSSSSLDNIRSYGAAYRDEARKNELWNWFTGGARSRRSVAYTRMAEGGTLWRVEVEPYLIEAIIQKPAAATFAFHAGSGQVGGIGVVPPALRNIEGLKRRFLNPSGLDHLWNFFYRTANNRFLIGAFRMSHVMTMPLCVADVFGAVQCFSNPTEGIVDVVASSLAAAASVLATSFTWVALFKPGRHLLFKDAAFLGSLSVAFLGVKHLYDATLRDRGTTTTEQKMNRVVECLGGVMAISPSAIPSLLGLGLNLYAQSADRDLPT